MALILNEEQQSLKDIAKEFLTIATRMWFESGLGMLFLVSLLHFHGCFIVLVIWIMHDPLFMRDFMYFYMLCL